jgi:RNA polymerase sigma factor (sigma-70 family)
MSLSSSEQSRSSRVHVLATELYREHRSRLLHVAMRNVANRADAEEALQDSLAIFLRAYDPDSGAPALAWLTLTLKRRCWALYRAQHLDRCAGQESRLDSEEPGFSIDGIAAEGAGAEEAIERAERVLDARKRLATLKPAERRALVLIAAGYSYQEIGAALNWTYSKTNRCAAEGRAALRAAVPS